MQATINGATLHYVDQGDPAALPVVFLHGFPFSRRLWDREVELTAARWRAIAVDLRGHGESSVGDGQYTIEGHVDDLIGLLDHLGIERAVLVGLSMGGYIALRAVERNPERVRALVLADTRSEADDDAGRLKRAETIRTVKAHGAEVFARAFLPAVFAPASLTGKPEAVELIRATIAGTAPLSLAGTLLALAARTDTTASLHRIAVPTLVLVGEHDALTPPAAARALQERIPGARLQVIPGAGHLSNLENPAEFQAALLEFLEGLGADA